MPPNGFHDLRCRRGLRRRSHRCACHGLIGAHHRGGLDPHPHIVGLVDSDRNGVDTKEIRRQQHPVGGVVGGQLASVGTAASAVVYAVAATSCWAAVAALLALACVSQAR